MRDWLAGRENPESKVESAVREIIEAVRERGDEAVIDYTRRFDCASFDHSMLRVPAEAIERAEIPADDLAILTEAAENIRRFHMAQVRQSWFTTREDGTVLGQLVRPVDRAGLYVPGGRGGETPLISTLLMAAIPAQCAGVRSIALVSPPRPDGGVNPYILAAAKLLGLTEIYAMGSAWSIAALALGAQSVAPVDVIAGPGNIFVTTAKRLLQGTVGIDMIAGPSEIAILATANTSGNASTDAQALAADMLSQAEHDALASAILITPDQGLAEAVRRALVEQLDALPESDKARKSLADWGALVLVPDLATGMDCVNRLAPEHLELVTEAPWELLGQVRNAGAIFVGPNTPEPLGDYFAGPNHTLPTMGTARFSQALSVETFTKNCSVLAASAAFTREVGRKVARFARLETLEAHARSVERRLK